MKTTIVKLSEIKPDPKNPRQEFNPEDMGRLEESIKANGILNPLMVEETKEGYYLLVDGERRFRASTNIKLKEVPVVILSPMTDLERLVKRFHLQEQHQSWGIFEKAKALAIFKEETGMSVAGIAGTMGMSTKLVSDYLVVGILTKRTTNYVAEKKLPFDWLIEIARLVKVVPDESLRQDVEDAIVEKINSKVILKTKEIRRYNLAVRKVGMDIVKRIIKEKDFTSTDAIVEAGLEGVEAMQQLYTVASYVSTYANRVLEHKGKKTEMPEKVITLLEKLKTSIEKILRAY